MFLRFSTTTDRAFALSRRLFYPLFRANCSGLGLHGAPSDPKSFGLNSCALNPPHNSPRPQRPGSQLICVSFVSTGVFCPCTLCGTTPAGQPPVPWTAPQGRATCRIYGYGTAERPYAAKNRKGYVAPTRIVAIFLPSRKTLLPPRLSTPHRPSHSARPALLHKTQQCHTTSPSAQKSATLSFEHSCPSCLNSANFVASARSDRFPHLRLTVGRLPQRQARSVVNSYRVNASGRTCNTTKR